MRVVAACLLQSTTHVPRGPSLSATAQIPQPRAQQVLCSKRVIFRDSYHCSPDALGWRVCGLVCLPRCGIRELEDHGSFVRGHSGPWELGLSLDKKTRGRPVLYATVVYYYHVLATVFRPGAGDSHGGCARHGSLEGLGQGSTSIFDIEKSKDCPMGPAAW